MTPAPALSAFLSLIAFSEGADYNTIVTGVSGPATFSDFSDHPFAPQFHRMPVVVRRSPLLESTAVRKVGFGLSGDLRQLRHRLKVEPRAVLDLDTVFRERGWRKEVGVKAAIAILFGQRFIKSKKVATTNWALPQLGPSQITYAANDAYAAIKVYEALKV